MSPKTLFVINPISGGNNKTSLINTIERWGQSSKGGIEIWETTGQDDREKLRQKIEEYQPAQVVSVGGDGTVLLCATVLMHTPTVLGIIPRGSANGMATELGIPDDVDECLEIIEKNRCQPCDLLLFNNRLPALHISDIGVNAGLVKRFESSGRRGFLGYAQGVLGQLKDATPFTVKVATENQKFEKQCLMLAFGNAKRYGTGAVLNNIGKIDDGMMELSFLHSVDLTSIAGHFFDLVNDDSEHMTTVQCKKATIEVSCQMPFQIDGEYQGEIDKLSVEVLPRSLQLIVP